MSDKESADKTPDERIDRLLGALSSNKWHFVYRDPASCPATLLEAFKKEITHVPVDSWEKRIAWGGAYYNGRAARKDLTLVPPCWIEYFEPKFPIEEAEKVFKSLDTSFIVYEDEDLLVVYKPSGLSCLPNREQTYFNLKKWICDHLTKSGREPGPHLPSRLDTSTEGLVITSISARMHSVLQHAFEKREVEKTYLFETQGVFPGGVISCEEPIGKDRRHPILRKVVALEEGQQALTIFEGHRVKSEGGPVSSIVKAYPETGRTHQIRVHSAYLGYPVMGDPFYGKGEVGGLRLLCHELRFFNPFRNEMQTFSVPPRLLPMWAGLTKTR